MTEQNHWENIPKQYAGRWAYDYDEKLHTFFVHCGGHRILDAEDSEVAHAVCRAHNAAAITAALPHMSGGGLTEAERAHTEACRKSLKPMPNEKREIASNPTASLHHRPPLR